MTEDERTSDNASGRGRRGGYRKEAVEALVIALIVGVPAAAIRGVSSWIEWLVIVPGLAAVGLAVAGLVYLVERVRGSG